MRLRTSVCAAAALLVVSSLAVLDAQPTTAPQRPVGRVPAGAAAAGRATTVFGFVWDANNNPIANANVRLRNVATGRVEAHAVASASGEFSFDNIEGGSYVIEYVDHNGRVIAVGHVFSVAPGETVATFIRLGANAPWFAALFGSAANTAATVVSSAASLGVTAVAPAPRDVTADH